MYEEDFVFGPFTTKQFFAIAGAAGIGFVINKLEILTDSQSMVVYVVIGLLALFAVYNLKPTKIQDIGKYFEDKRRTLGDEQFTRFINRKIAEITSQIELRKMKGLVEDPQLAEKLQLFIAQKNAKRV